MITARPGRAAVIRPLSSTEATAGQLLAYVSAGGAAGSGESTAFSCAVPPGASRTDSASSASDSPSSWVV